ncbi:MAG: malonic semialdehyde reductase [Candidatus Nanopelagicales bacterium]
MSATAEATPFAIDELAADVLFREAHTAYGFTGETVSDAELESIYELMKFAPTMNNAQPLRITFLRGEAAKARLIKHIADGNKAKSEQAPVVAILAADTDFHQHLPRLAPQSQGARERFGASPMREQIARNNAWMQAGYFIIAARAVGLDAGPMGGFNAAGVDEEFFAGTAQRTIMIVNLGHASAEGQFPRNPRFGFDEVVDVL